MTNKAIHVVLTGCFVTAQTRGYCDIEWRMHYYWVAEMQGDAAQSDKWVNEIQKLTIQHYNVSVRALPTVLVLSSNAILTKAVCSKFSKLILGFTVQAIHP